MDFLPCSKWNHQCWGRCKQFSWVRVGHQLTDTFAVGGTKQANRQVLCLTLQLVDPQQRCWWTDGLVLCLTNCDLMWLKLYIAVKKSRKAIMTLMLILECWLLITQSWLGALFKVNHLLGYRVRSLPVQDHCRTRCVRPMGASFIIVLITYSMQQDSSLWFKLIQMVGLCSALISWPHSWWTNWAGRSSGRIASTFSENPTWQPLERYFA